MKKPPLYSRSPRRLAPAAGPRPPSAAAGGAAAAGKPGSPTDAPADEQATRPAWRKAISRWGNALMKQPPALRWGLFGLGCVAASTTLTLSLLLAWMPRHPAITQEDIDAAVRESLEKEPLPSAEAKAAEAVAVSVVRVMGLTGEDDGSEDSEKRALNRALGTGVVIIDNGTILTNLHVVAGASRIRVRFHNGHESDAQLINVQPENDLAVLKASSLPDDLEAATMRSTADLRPGDHVVAVGHPFGIGPSVSAGVVSGLKREFRDRQGNKTLTNLIQFDAAANPGNSGGPLVTLDGHVVGIVTAILNPSEQRTFIGIGFAVPIENAASAVGMPPF